ncbi:peptidoglycan DD-metalloendopeptidase family protein [candidate division KSB1 bacterium]
MSKNFKMVLFSHDSATTKEFSFSKFHIFIISFFVFAVSATLITFSVNILSDLLYSYRLDLLRQQRDTLTMELKAANDQIDEIGKRVEEIFKSDDELRTMVNIDQMDLDLREVGVGGSASIPSSRTEFFFTEQEMQFSIEEKLQKLRNQIIVEERSYGEIFNGLNEQKEMVRYYPSIKPVIGGRLTDGFGWRVDPFNHLGKDMHEGVDISIKVGTPIYATADGIVSKIENNANADNLGRYIKIDHNSGKYGYESIYGHLSKVEPGLKVGSVIKRGDKIAESGKTGRVTAPHLHYGLIFYGKKIDPEAKNWSAGTFRNK